MLSSVRPPDRWYASFRETIYEALQRPVAEAEGSPEAIVFGMARQVVIGRSFGGHLGDRDALVAAYERHNATVRAGIAPERLLEFDVVQGWEPLCAFLGVEVPEEPFPNVNDRAAFRAFLGLDSA